MTGRPDPELAALVEEARDGFRLAKLAQEDQGVRARELPAGTVTLSDLERWFRARGVPVRVTLRGHTVDVERLVSSGLDVRLVPVG